MSAPEDVWSVTVPPTGSFSAMKNLVVGKPKGGGGARVTQINTSSVEVLHSGMPRSVATTVSLKSPAGTEVPTRKMLPKLLSISSFVPCIHFSVQWATHSNLPVNRINEQTLGYVRWEWSIQYLPEKCSSDQMPVQSLPEY